MQAIDDIFELWPDLTAFAAAVGQKRDTVYRWQRSGRIPDTAWDDVIAAAKKLGKKLTVEQLHSANRPSRQRGAPAHKNGGEG